MIARCTNQKNLAYHRYGGRGIVVCKRWRIFPNFYADMGDAPQNLTLDRINNDGNYEPSNCRWVSPLEQANNTSRNRIIQTSLGPMTIRQAAMHVGITINAIRLRLKRGARGDEVIMPNMRPRKKCKSTTS